ncbi:MAG: hypothetical protein ACI4VN_02695 [Clostridia bacterium]
MSRRKSSKQLRNMAIALIVLILLVLIAFVVFIFNVNISGGTSISVENILSNEVTNEVEENVTSDGIVPPENMLASTYDSIDFDEDATFQVKVFEGKVYFSIINNEAFKEKYNVSDTDIENIKDEKEIATHDYKVQEVYIEKCLNNEFLLVMMKDGTLGIMNIQEALKENVFRIKKELISLDKPIVRIYGAVRNLEDETFSTTILVTSDEKKYDLQKFVE